MSVANFKSNLNLSKKQKQLWNTCTLWIAVVAVMKHHQWLGKIRIISPAFHSKLFSKKLCHAIYALDTLPQSSLHSICLRARYKCRRFIQHTLVWNVSILAEKNNFADSTIVWVKNIMVSSCRWWCILTATCANIF